jgi:hypothetical protein
MMVGRVVHLQRRLFNVDDRRNEDVATSPGYACAASISPFQLPERKNFVALISADL